MALKSPPINNTAMPLVQVEDVTLRIPIVRRGTKALLPNPFSLLASFYTPKKTSRVLRTILSDLSFNVDDGHRLALIGRNGAGKTTLLRVLAGSLTPNRGTITTRGKIEALLNISLGLRSEATGLENIYLRSLSQGMTLGEIKTRVPDIVEFSELGDAIYDPIQTYSAGMRARLAFSIATSRAPTILLMDEWISAGDQYFVAKAHQRLETQVSECRALVIASHVNSLIAEMCTHGLVLEAGRNVFYGKVDDALKFYAQMGAGPSPASSAQIAVG